MDTEMQRDFNDAWRTVRTEYPDLPAAAPCDSDYLQQIFTDIMDLMADVAKNTASATKLPTRPANSETPLQPRYKREDVVFKWKNAFRAYRAEG